MVFIKWITMCIKEFIVKFLILSRNSAIIVFEHSATFNMWQHLIEKTTMTSNHNSNNPISEIIRKRIIEDNGTFFANHNISKYIEPGDIDLLIDELSVKFEGVLQSLIVDTDKDPNSKGSARRLAKMYLTETFSGRYEEPPAATSFPNDSDTRYEGMLVVRSELRSMCSHHQPPAEGDGYTCS